LVIQRLEASVPTAMAGDGINDDAALATATVGPALWLGQLAILFLGLHPGWFPVGGRTNPRSHYRGLEAHPRRCGPPRPSCPRGTPNPTSPHSGCRFRTRCWKAEAICVAEEPNLADRGDGHPVACHFRGLEANDFK
jgi:oligopeptide/dipeptide ABC transporter ATP-binding protein